MAKRKTVRKNVRKSKSDKAASWLFLVPTMLFLGVTALLPLLYSVYLSFFKMKLNLPNAVPEFVGLSNYIRMFTDEALHVSTLNTLLFAVVSVKYWWDCLLPWRFVRTGFGQDLQHRSF